MEPAAATTRRPIQIVLLALISAAIVVLSHLPLLRLPYYWDEAGQFVPAALDILHGGHWIPQSVAPNVHPPAVMAYLAAIWRLAGFTPFVTRFAMLLLASLALPLTFVLCLELSPAGGRRQAMLAASLLCVSPLFFAQSMLAQLDAPAMLFTTLALLLFLQDWILAAAIACVLLVLVKETGVIVPLLFAGWLAYERRVREAAWFIPSLLAVAAWIAALAGHTGNWAGNSDFVRFNLVYLYHPLGMAWRLGRRLYYLFFADFHWLGAIAIISAWRAGKLFRTRSWRVAWLLVGAHLAMFTVLGGAVIQRYMLPVLPILYAAIAASLALYRPLPRRICSIALLAGLALSNFWNPPYAFPWEENLAFTDFLKLHSEAAAWLSAHHPDDCVQTLWPLTVELSEPELGFVRRRLDVRMLPDTSARTLQLMDRSKVQVLALFSQSWNPRFGLARLPGIVWLRDRFSDYVPAPTRDELLASIPLPLSAHFERSGQWVDIFVNPAAPPAVRACGGR